MVKRPEVLYVLVTAFLAFCARIMALPAAAVAYVDDASGDPRLQYFGNWTHTIDVVPNTTTTMTSANDTSIVFKFNGAVILFTRSDTRVLTTTLGTAIEVFGRVHLEQTQPAPISAYQMDDWSVRYFTPVTEGDHVLRCRSTRGLRRPHVHHQCYPREPRFPVPFRLHRLRTYPLR